MLPLLAFLLRKDSSHCSPETITAFLQVSSNSKRLSRIYPVLFSWTVWIIESCVPPSVDTATIIVITIVVDSVTIRIEAALLVAGEAILIGTHNVERGTAGTAFVTLFIGIF